MSKHKNTKMLKGYIKPSLFTSLASPILIDKVVSGVESTVEEVDEDSVHEDEEDVQSFKRRRTTDVSTSSRYVTETSNSDLSSISRSANLTAKLYFQFLWKVSVDSVIDISN